MTRARTIRRRKNRTLPEINLTPLIDTALTLLVIFMVTTPIIQNSIKIDLPKGQSQEAGKEIQQEMVVAVDADGTITFNGSAVELGRLGDTIKDHLAQVGGQEKRVWVKIDKNKPCDMLLSVIDRIKFVAGVKDVAVAMEQAGSSAA